MNTEEQKKLDIAVLNCKVALARAYVCGYISTVREEKDRYIKERWLQYSKISKRRY